jgi:hypothetical protein
LFSYGSIREDKLVVSQPIVFSDEREDSVFKVEVIIPLEFTVPLTVLIGCIHDVRKQLDLLE